MRYRADRNDFIILPLVFGASSALLLSRGAALVGLQIGWLVWWLPGMALGLALAWFAHRNHAALYRPCPHCDGTGEIPRATQP